MFVKSTCDADALTLPAGKPNTALSHDGLVLLRPSLNDVGDLCLACDLPDTLMVYLPFRYAKGYIFFDCSVRKKNSLRDMRNMSLPVATVGRRNALAIYL